MESNELMHTELRTASLEELGQMVKVSTSLTAEMFPYKAKISTHSPFFMALRDRVYQGKEVDAQEIAEGKPQIKWSEGWSHYHGNN